MTGFEIQKHSRRVCQEVGELFSMELQTGKNCHQANSRKQKEFSQFSFLLWLLHRRNHRFIIMNSEADTIQGIICLVGADSYLKYYYYGERLLEGILPGDIWLKGKYIPAPAGWQD